MSETAKTAQPATEVHTVVGPLDTHLSIAALDGDEINAGSLDDWLQGMRMRQAVQSHMQEWVKTVGELAAQCRSWLSLNSEWATEIAVRFNAEPASVSLYVVVRDPQKIRIDQRRLVADMGLAIGGGFGVRAEARVVSIRPENHSFILT